MRPFVERPVALAIIGLAAVLSGRALAQSDSAPAATSSAEEPEEVTVRGRRTLTQYRLELERARDDIIEIFNEANSGEDNDITCRDEQPTGTRMRHNQCRSNSEGRGDSAAARSFLNTLFASTGGFIGNPRGGVSMPGGGAPPAGGPQLNAAIGTGEAQADGVVKGEAARANVQAEIERLMGENRQLYRAVTRYVELEDEYNRAREASTQ